MLTAAVRDLHLCYPNQFETDVRSAGPELWENNPYVTPLVEGDPGVESIECSYPLINHANQRPYHCLHGFIEFLNETLQLSIKPTRFKGDIHLSAQELETRARIISQDLRCLVCQNQSIDDSNATLAKDLRMIVRERLEAGDSNEQVFNYVVSRYGNYVLLDPPFQADTFLLWASPFFILVIALGVAFIYLKRRPELELSEDTNEMKDD